MTSEVLDELVKIRSDIEYLEQALNEIQRYDMLEIRGRDTCDDLSDLILYTDSWPEIQEAVSEAIRGRLKILREKFESA